MSIQVTVNIPEDVYRRAKQIARSSNRKVGDVLAEAIVLDESSPEPVTAVDREGAAFRRLHPTLLRDYPGQYVAVHGEVVVDHDPDQVALFLRAKERFPTDFVWIAPVGESPEESYRVYSPRLARDDEG